MDASLRWHDELSRLYPAAVDGPLSLIGHSGAMRILHVLDHGLPLHSGYTFRPRAIVPAQQARGLEVACLPGARHQAEGPDPETIDGITFHRTPAPAASPSPLREWLEIKALEARLDRLVGGWRAGQLHVHFPLLHAPSAPPVGERPGPPLLYQNRAFLGGAAV